MTMTLDEAIEHADANGRDTDCACAADHRQLAEWLRELRETRRVQETAKDLSDETVFVMTCPDCRTSFTLDHGKITFDRGVYTVAYVCPTCWEPDV